MTKRICKFFFNNLVGQARWLNALSAQGYHLKSCGKLIYEFDSCQPEEYEYSVENVSDKNCIQLQEYQQHLEALGYRTFTKNINLNFSFGKIKWRPYAAGNGKIASSPGGYNKELLIVEKNLSHT